jgi:hypothetical protein
MTSQTSQETSWKVYIQYFDLIKRYKTDKMLPIILDEAKNGGQKHSMTKDEWLEFCEAIDACFNGMNRMQYFIFFGKIANLFTIVPYVMVVNVGLGSALRLDIILFLIGFLVGVILLSCYVHGPMKQKAFDRVEVICQRKTVELNLEAGEESAVCIELHYAKRKRYLFCSCEEYEVDSKDDARIASTFLKISRGTGSLELPSNHSHHRTNDTAPNRYEFDGTSTDVENQHIPMALPLGVVPLAPHRRDANIEPYVTLPMAKARVYQSDEQSNDEVVQYIEAALRSYVQDSDVTAALPPYVQD